MRGERWLYALPLRLRSLFRRREVERELDDELRFHVAEQTALLVARGISAAEARREALRSMGGLERRKEECREERRVNVIEDLLTDARYAVRRLRRTPGYTVVALLTLSLGLGANTAVFTVVNGVLLRPLAYHDPQQLVVPAGTVAPADFLDWRSRNRTLARIGAAEWWSPTLTAGDRPEQVTALRVSTDIFPLLGVEPMLGRTPRADEERDGAPPVVVLGYNSWKTRFAADSHAVGKTMVFDGTAFTIVGVMPPGFQFAPYWATAAELWAPLMLDSRKNDRNGSSLRVFGRRAAGASIAQVRADLASVMAPIDSAHAAFARRLTVVPLRNLVVEDVDAQLKVLQTAVILLLIISCANGAHLQLIRAASGERESAVRIALGASGSRLVQQSLVESTILCAGGAVLGLAIGYATVRALVAFAPPGLPRIDSIRLDWGVFAYLAGMAMLATLACGVAPALRITRVRAGDAMRGSRGSSDTPGRRRFRNVLVVSEFAMTLVLLAGAGLVLRSFAAMLRVDPGFDARSTVSMEIALRGTSHDADAAHAPFYEELVRRVAALPGVDAASLTNHVPIAGDHWPFPYAIEGRPFPAQGATTRALFRIAVPGYFGVMRIPLIRGRDFSAEDVRSLSHVMIINDAMARRNWPGANPIGQRVSVDDPAKHAEWFTVIGVAANVKQGRWTDDTVAEMYFPYLPPANAATSDGTLVSLLHPQQMTLVVRAKGDLDHVARAAGDVVHAMDPAAAVANVATFERIVGAQFVQPRFYLLLLGAFAFVALALAAVGVYGVTSYSVAQRTREFGVRAALGATRGNAFDLVMKQGISLAFTGCAIGLAAALVSMRFARALLFQVKPYDAATFASVCVLLGVVALVACLVPARRAARLDPVVALQAE